MDSRPNILFIVADDLNSWIGALGRHPSTLTPNIDALARRGTLFSNAYCAAPYCNASRMAVFTGCRPETTGVYANEEYWAQEERHPTFLELLGEHGYYRFGVGKVFHGQFDYATAGRSKSRRAEWLELQNRESIWDRFISNAIEPLPPFRPLNGMFDFDNFDSVDPWNHHFDWGALPDEDEATMPDHLVALKIEDFLANASEEPFFCAAGIYKPHLPWYVPRRFFLQHPLEAVALPFVKSDDLDDVPGIARTWAETPNDHQTIIQHSQWKAAVQAYMASITYCDEIVGRIVKALYSSKFADNTIVVLWGDNGFHLGEKLHWRKFVLWEEATRVPLIIVPTERDQSKPIVSDCVSLLDIFPTLFEMAGLQTNANIDGRSLYPQMYSAAVRNVPAITTWLKGNSSLRLGNWRFTRYRDGNGELYNHAVDPFEWNNLHESSKFSQTIMELEREMTVALQSSLS